MLKGKVLVFSVFLLLVVLVSSQETEESSKDEEVQPSEKEEQIQARSYSHGYGKISIEDIDGPRCTKLLVSGHHGRPDSSIRASSHFIPNQAYYAPPRARIYRRKIGSLYGGWSSRFLNVNQWLQFDLGLTRTVVGVVTKGRQDNEQFVKTYRIQFSNNGVFWYIYKDRHGVQKDFQGNFDLETAKVNTLYPPIRARYIRINPRTWHGWISMRADVLGCL